MVLDIKPEDIRTECDIERVARMLRSIADELALLGDLDSARQLTTLVSTADFYGTAVQHSNLVFAWHLSGKHPEGIAETFTQQRHLKMMRKRNAIVQDVVTYDQAENEARLMACIKPADNVNDFVRSIGPRTSENLVQALQLTLHLQASIRDGEDAIKLSDLHLQSRIIIAEIISRWTDRRYRQQVELLTGAEYLWQYWSRGLLADAFGLTRDDVQHRGQAYINTFRARLAHGFVPSPLAAKTMRELLEIGEQNSLDPTIDEYNETRSGPLLKAPATVTEIEGLEERLEAVLPDDYQEFLRTSNGFGKEEYGIYNGFFPDPELYPISKVHWVEDEYFQLPVEFLTLPREIVDLATECCKPRKSQPTGALDFGETPFPLFDRVLEIGTRDIDNLWLVHPQLVEQCRDAYHEMYVKADEKQKKIILLAMESFAGSKEAFEQLHWCVVKWSSGGSASLRAYASFRAYLEIVVQDSAKDKTLGFV